MTISKKAITYTRTIMLFPGFGVTEKNPDCQPVVEYHEFTGEPMTPEDYPHYQSPRRTPSISKDFKAAAKANKKKREELLRTTEKIQQLDNLESMIAMVKKNNAAAKHLLTFVVLSNFAFKNKRGLALAHFKKKLRRDYIAKEWSLIQNYLGKYSVDGGLACSIGLKENGWLTLRIIGVTNGEYQAPLSLTVQFFSWLIKRGWKDTISASNDNAMQLQDHYLLKPVDSEQVFAVYTPEMFVVVR